MTSKHTMMINILIICFILLMYIEMNQSFLINGYHVQRITKCKGIHMGLFDDIKSIFSKENARNSKELNDKKKEEMMLAQKEILERRRNPKKMAEYEEMVQQRRRGYAEERAVYNFQQKALEGYDPLTDWKKLKDEGKIKIGKDLQTDEGTKRLGSEGLYDVRVDERMPYIDQGYVDDDADVMGKIMNLFKKKDNSK